MFYENSSLYYIEKSLDKINIMSTTSIFKSTPLRAKPKLKRRTYLIIRKIQFAFKSILTIYNLFAAFFLNFVILFVIS